MIQKCYRCEKVYGEKEPIEDKSVTHGLCSRCFPKELVRVEKEADEYLRKGYGLAASPK